MSLRSFRGRALARLAAFCLGTSALSGPALAASFSVGGGTITTNQADSSTDNTGSGGGFALQANTTSNNDTIVISNVAINNAGGRALDVGGQLPSSGSYSVAMHGSSLTGAAGAWFQSVGGLISLDTTGGAANTMSGSLGLTVTNGSNNGGVALNLGADTITSSSEALQAIGQGTGTISIDLAGTTITSTGTYGIVAQNGLGSITIGGLNGGVSGTVNATSGIGILTGNNGNQSITLASSGVINAMTGISVQGNTVNVDSFGTIYASGDAITALNGTGPALTVTLESSSVTKGTIVGGNASNTFNIVAGADISNATFNGNGGTTTLNLTGTGNDTLVLSTASNIANFQMLGTGVWILIGSPASTGTWTIASGTLRTFTSTNLNTVIINGGTFDLDNQSVTVGALFGSGGTISLGLGSITTNSSANTTVASTISGSGSLIKTGTGTLTLTGANSYSGGTVVNGGVLQLGAGGSLASTGLLLVNAGTFDLNSLTQTVAGLSGAGGTIDLGSGSLTTNSSITGQLSASIVGSGSLTKAGSGTLILSGTNIYTGGTLISGGILQLGLFGSLASSGAVTVNGGTFDLNGHTQTVGALAGSGGTIIGNQGFLTTNSNVNTTLDASMSGLDGFTKAGTGTLTLTGTNSNFFGSVTVSAGTLQVGNGGTTGTLPGAVTDNASLIFNRSDTFTFAGNISGSGSVQQAGTGTLILTGFSNQFTGTTMVSAGTLQIGNNAAGPYLSGNFVNNSNLAFAISGPGSIVGVISGTGTVLVIGGTTTLAAANTYSGGTIVNAGTLQLGTGGSLLPTGALTVNGGTFSLNGLNQTVGALSGSGGFIALTNATLTTNSSANTTFAGQFTGINNSGFLVTAGSGTLTLTGSSIIAGGVTIAAGTLQLGNGGSSGFIFGNTTDNGTLAFDRSDNVAFAGLISGTGAVMKLGSGTLTLSGTNSYSGVTNVTAGTLNVIGSIASSSVSVASGATLTGTGKVGSASVAAGGTLNPGSSTAPGTLTISGNLNLASGSSFTDAITPTAAGLANVSGTASINGNALANFASGAYTAGQHYTLVTASGGLGGSFASLATTGLPGNLRASLSYDANDAFLNLSPNALTPSLASNTTTNQHNVVAAIDAAVTAGAVPSGGFNALYGLSGASLNSAIDQISGQAAPNVSNAVGQTFFSFLAMTAEGGAGDAGSYAPGNAYDAASAPHRAQLDAGQTRVWGAAYGGHVGLSADAASGAAALSASNVGLIGGADMQLGDRLLAGITLGWGQQHFNSGNGSGISNDYAFGLYGRADMSAAYVTAAFGYGWHQITTLRAVTVSGTDVLQGKQNADDFGGRIEAGWRLALDDTYTIAPYGAFAGESFESPAYAETAISGASSFALSYAAHTSTLGRSELGAHLNRSYDLGDGGLTADLKAAWAHQLDDLPFTQANFENLATTSFQVLGVRPTRDTALLGADLKLQYRSGLFLGLKGQGQFGAGTTIVEGMGSFGLRW